VGHSLVVHKMNATDRTGVFRDRGQNCTRSQKKRRHVQTPSRKISQRVKCQAPCTDVLGKNACVKSQGPCTYGRPGETRKSKKPGATYGRPGGKHDSQRVLRQYTLTRYCNAGGGGGGGPAHAVVVCRKSSSSEQQQ